MMFITSASEIKLVEGGEWKWGDWEIEGGYKAHQAAVQEYYNKGR
jgi:hypothetical protein